MADKKFRVIIAGAGPIGLATGYALHAAGIDYVILEQRPDLPKDGLTVMLMPPSTRIFDQFGIEEKARAVALPMQHKTNLEFNGNILSTSPLFDILKEQHGYDCSLFMRSDLMDVLAQNLPSAETRIRFNSKIVDIELDDAAGGVKVRLADGTVEAGSIVIGADGVHSKTRRIMQQLARKFNVAIIDKDLDPMGWKTQVLFGVSSVPDGFPIGSFHEGRAKNRTAHALGCPDFVPWVMFRRFPQISTARVTYTEKDMEEMAEEFKDVFVAPNHQFKQLWATRQWAKCMNQQEGFVQQWHHGRIVLVGDSISTMTSNSGLGFNDGLQSVVVLVNKIQSLLRTNEHPDTAALEQVFSQYVDTRFKVAKEVNEFGAFVTRVSSWDNLALKLVDKYVAPMMGGDPKLLVDKMGPIWKNGAILDFVPFEGKQGTKPWNLVSTSQESQ